MTARVRCAPSVSRERDRTEASERLSLRPDDRQLCLDVSRLYREKRWPGQLMRTDGSRLDGNGNV